MSEGLEKLYQANKEALWNHCSQNHNLHLLESEGFDLWVTATESLRKEIKRLEQLLAFQTRGRVQDWERHLNARSDKTRLDYLDQLFRVCPHAEITHNDDPDAELPIGFSITVDGCERQQSVGETLREVIDRDRDRALSAEVAA